MGVLVQVIATLIICFSSLNAGIFFVWPSSTILLFKSENTTLQRPMGDLEISLLCSLPSFANLVTLPLLFGVIIDRLGRKHTLTITALLIVLAWTIIASSKRVEAILVASVIAGCGNAVCLIVSIYVAEIAQNSIRGTLTCGQNVFCCIGFLVSYCLGGSLEYHMMIYTCLSLAVIGVLMITFLKESPVTLMVKGREEEAAKSVAFYRRIGSTSKEVTTELNHIRLTILSNSEDASLMLGDGKTEIKPLKTKKISSWQIFKTSPIVRRQFCLAMVLNTSYVCHGLTILQMFAEPVFAIAVGDAISPNLCSIILGAVVLIAGIIAAYLIETVGRRPLQLHSSIVSGVCCAVVGIQIATEWLPKWTVPFFICIFAVSFMFGSGTVPFVITAEIFLPEVKSVFLTLLQAWMLTCQFILLFLCNLIIPQVGLASLFFFFSFTCFSTSVYFFYFLPETKGLSVYTIQSLFTTNVKTGSLGK